MADPLSALGAATAGLELGLGAVKSILGAVRLLRELKDAPKEVSEIVDDLTRAAARIGSLSSTTGDLTPEQHVRISRPIAEFNAATESLVGKLEALTAGQGKDGRKRGALKRAVNRGLYLQMRDEVRAERVRLDRLDQEVKGELQVILAESQGLIREHVARTLSFVQDTIGPDVKDTRAAATAIQDGLDSGFRQTRTHIDSELAYHSESVHRKLDLLTLGFFMSLRQDRGLAMLHQATGSPSDPASMLQRLVATDHSSPEDPEPGVKDKDALAQQAAWQLGRYPSALGEACDGLRTEYRRRKLRCRCRPSIETRSAAGGILRFEAERSARHLPDCPRNTSSSWRYSLSFRLAPFLNKAVQLTLGATSGAGGWSLAPPIRVVPRIRAVDSPAYRLFDACQGIHYSNMRDPTCFEATIKKLKQLHTDLEECLQKRPTSIYEIIDLDWTDITVWDCVWRMLGDLRPGTYTGDLGHPCVRVYREAAALAHLLCRYGVDPAEEQGIYQNCGALESAWALEIPASAWGDGHGHQVYNTMRGLGALEACGRISWTSASPYLRRQYLRQHPDLRIYLEAELSELTVLLMAGHSSEDLSRLKSFDKQQLKTEVFFRMDTDEVRTLGWEPDQYCNTSAAEMALGWPEGLEYVVGLGCEIRAALYLNLQQYDLESLRIILKTPTAIFSPRESPSLLETAASVSSRHEVLEAAAVELASRRRMLNDYALKVLEPDHCAEYGLRPGKLLVRNSAQVFETMTGRYYAAEVPENLICHSEFSTYEFLLKVDPDKWCDYGDSSHLDPLFRAGFDDVDAPDGSGETVLFKWCLRPSHSPPHIPDPHVTLWLLRHGSERTFPAGVVLENQSYPGAQFQVAGVLGMEHLKDTANIIRPGEMSQLALRAKAALTPPDATVADGCVCYCSSSRECSARGSCASRGCCSPAGCRPHCMFRMLTGKTPTSSLHGDGLARVSAATLHRSRNRLLHQWGRWCGISGMDREEYYLRACRLELFERLDMAHTCCLSRMGTGDQGLLRRRVCPDEDEQAEMREEDEESARQLEAMMREYRLARWRYRGSPLYARKGRNGSAVCFWDLWWGAVDVVLPLTVDDDFQHRHAGGFSQVIGAHFRMVQRTMDLIFHVHRVQRTTFVASRRRSQRAMTTLANMKSKRIDAVMEKRLKFKQEGAVWWLEDLLEERMLQRMERRRRLWGVDKEGRPGRRSKRGQMRRQATKAVRHRREVQVKHKYGRWFLWVGFRKWAKALERFF
ncbi:hypothetical protein RB595_007261 [Gaeumannomyces hyphopodioides]